jgi:hypothetical protein
MTLWRMRIVCWIPKATNTFSEYIIPTYCFSTATIVKRTRLSDVLYIRFLSCFIYQSLRDTADVLQGLAVYNF